MYKASNDTSKNYETMEAIIKDCGWDGVDVLNILTDWHGLSLLSEAFMENLINCEL